MGALIAGTLSGLNFGGALDRIKSLHVAVKLLASKGPPPHKYSGEPGAAYKKLFEQMQKVVDGTVPLDTKIDNGLTIQQWFNGGFVGDFLYLLEYEAGSICKQANCFAEFFAYGGVRKASKGGVGGGLGADASAQASWNAFWGGQEFFVNNIVHPNLVGGMSFGNAVQAKPGMADNKVPGDKTGRDRAMAAMKQCTGGANPQIFSTCAAFTKECTFAGGFWIKKKQD